MRIIIFTLLLFILPGVLFSQTCLYKGSSTYSSDCIGKIAGDKIYIGPGAYPSDCKYTFTGSQIYLGNSTHSSDLIYRINENKVYLVVNGRSHLIYTIHGNRIYLGDATVSSQCLYTVKDNKVYLSDGYCCVASFDGPVSVFIIACILGPY
jgi:hypothetical protein